MTHIIYIAGFKPTVRATVRADTDVDTDPEYVKSLSDGLVKGMLWNISVTCNQI